MKKSLSLLALLGLGCVWIAGCNKQEEATPISPEAKAAGDAKGSNAAEIAAAPPGVKTGVPGG